MSGLILPDYDTPAFVQGRRLKKPEELILLCGQLLFLRHVPEGMQVPRFKTNGYVGIIQCFVADPMYPKRAKGVGIIAGFGPGQFAVVEVEVLEACDPWCFPPGMPERAVSLLEE